MTRLLLTLIRLATPRADREFVVGDTVEELERIERTEGAAAARRWLRGELGRVLAAAPRHHLATHARIRRGRHHHRGAPMGSDKMRHQFDWATLVNDLRNAWRGLRAGRGTTALAFVIFTIAIAAGTVTFSVVDAVALRPLPFASPESLVSVSRVSTGDGRTLMPAAPQDYLAWRDRGVAAFETIATSQVGERLRLRADDGESFPLRRVTSNLFDVLGVHPFAGRFFSPEHEQPGHDGVVVLSYELWMRRFGGDPDAIGQHVTFIDFRNQRTLRQIVGVLPPGVTYPILAGPQEPAVYVPYIPSTEDRSYGSLSRSYTSWVVGRLRPGATLDQARTEVEHVSTAIAAEFPPVVPPPAAVTSLHDRVVGPAKSWLLLVLGGVGLVLLVACVNVAGLLLARATVRVRELATREALGASRARLARGFLLEGLILSLAASAAAIAMSFWGLALVKAHLPEGLARTAAIGVDARVLLVSIGVSILCGLTFASAPAWLASRSNLVALTKRGGGVISGRSGSRSFGAFLVAELAFVSLLLVATTLVVASFVLVTTADLGFDRRNVMSIYYTKSLQTVAETSRSAAETTFRADLLDRVRAVPGVTHAALMTSGSLPMLGGLSRYRIEVPGFGETTGDDMLETRMVTPGYFEAMGMQLVHGRTFEASDRAGAPRVALINDVAAQRFFGGQDPVGRVATFQNNSLTIVGVLRSVRFVGPEDDARPELYIPLGQEPAYSNRINSNGNLVVRTAGPAPLLAPAIREVIRTVLDGAEPSQAQFIDDAFRRLTAARRFNAGLMSIFGFVAIAIGAAGIYGTMAFVVAQQVRAIGLRMALGASPGRVMRSVLRDAAWRVVAGLAIGLTCAWAISSAFASLVFGVTPTEPGIYMMVAGIVVLIGLAAAIVPALRAARLDPLVALRTE